MSADERKGGEGEGDALLSHNVKSNPVYGSTGHSTDNPTGGGVVADLPDDAESKGTNAGDLSAYIASRGNIFHITTFFQAAYVSALFAGLAEREGGVLGATASFALNFPMAVVYGYKYIRFVSNPSYGNCTALAFGVLPGVAGFKLGVDGAKDLWSNDGFGWASSVFMFFNSASTRGTGAKALFDRLFGKKDQFQALIDDVKGMPYIQLEGSYNILDTQFHGFKNDVYQQRSCVLNVLDKSVSLTFGLGALVFTTPMWMYVSQKGWQRIDSSISGLLLSGLQVTTSASNTVFYAYSAVRFFSSVFLRLYGGMAFAMHNPNGSRCGNFGRQVLTFIGFAGLAYLAWLSGDGMRSEAADTDLSSVAWGAFTWLASFAQGDVYGRIMQFAAGAIANGVGLADFCTEVLPQFQWFQRGANGFLTLVGAKDKPQSGNTTSDLEAVAEGRKVLDQDGVIKFIYQLKDKAALQQENRRGNAGSPRSSRNCCGLWESLPSCRQIGKALTLGYCFNKD